jgi:hypothetical protein
MPSQQPLIDSPESQSSKGEDAALQQQVARLQLSGVLGEARLRNLFDYLAKKTLAGQSPKEIAIAIDVFGKTSDFDVSQDALVRVYIHKLRKALDDFYASPGAGGGAGLYLPRGEYRLKVNTRGSIAPRRGSLIKDRRLQLLSAAALGAAVLLGLGLGLGIPSLRAPQQIWNKFEQIRSGPAY